MNYTESQIEIEILHEKLKGLNENGEVARVLGSVGLPMVDMTTSIHYNTFEETQKKNKTIIIGLIAGVAVGGIILLVVGIAAIVYFMRRRGKVEQINVDEDNTNTIKISRKIGEDNSSLTDFELKNISKVSSDVSDRD